MVLFRSPEAHNDIYNHKANVRKSKFYDALARHKDDWNIVNSTDPAVHARKRRSMNLAFTEHSIKAATTSITTHVDRWNDICLSQPTDEEGWTAPKSMAAWAEVLVFDILGDLCFGVSFSTKEPGENPLKLIQPQIAETLQFVYAVSEFNVASCPVPSIDLRFLGVQIPLP
jgi:cytochrome P450